MNTTRHVIQFGLLSLGFLVWGFGPPAEAAQTNVTVGDDFFSPATVAIKPNDSVKWTWDYYAYDYHSTTRTGLWDSGEYGYPFTFTFTFTNAGSFPYFCSVHGSSGMTGSVLVTNQLPTVAITNPPNNSVFDAPASFTLAASASDPGGTISQVEFFRDSTSLGIYTNSPYSVAVTSLAAGTYTLTAVATDDAGATNTSAAVTVSVVTPVPVELSDPQRLSATQFRLTYTANAGLRYVVERSATLTNFAGINTNIAAGSSVTFTDDSATSDQNFYRVGRLPNP